VTCASVALPESPHVLLYVLLRHRQNRRVAAAKRSYGVGGLGHPRISRRSPPPSSPSWAGLQRAGRALLLSLVNRPPFNKLSQKERRAVRWELQAFMKDTPLQDAALGISGENAKRWYSKLQAGTSLG
jgi:hypothetical protein